MKRARIAVIGAGVIGLSTAANILQSIPDVSLTVIADKFEEETTSIGAGGHFRPNLLHLPGVSEHTLKKWAKTSRDIFFDLASSPESSTSGCMFFSGYLLHEDERLAVLSDLVLHFQKLSPAEMKTLRFVSKHGYVFTTTITEMTKYLPWLTSRIIQRGGKTLRRKLDSLHELIGEYDIVVNCCGLGARELVKDDTMCPVRGQLVKVRAPWIHKSYTYEGQGVSTYVYPNSKYVVLGGVRQKGNESLEPNSADTEDILRRTKQLVPALEGATVIGSWVGLRPTRSPVRLEQELIRNDRGQLKVVHNYGHGALGITLSWGTAADATKLVNNWLGNFQQSKL